MIALSIDGVEEHRGWTKVTQLHPNINVNLQARWCKRRLNISGLQHLCANQDILAYNCEESESCELPFPIIADSRRELAVALGMLDPDEKDKDGMPLTARCASAQNETPAFVFRDSLQSSTPLKGAPNPSLLCVFRCSSLAPTKG